MEQCVARLERGFAAAVDAAAIAHVGNLRFVQILAEQRFAGCQSAIQQTNCLRYKFAPHAVVAQAGSLLYRRQLVCERCYALLSLIVARMSATTSPFGFAPMLPLPCRRTETFPASMSRPPMTSIVWTFACSAS